MKFFIDTANVDEIRAANDLGIIRGVTTNPSLIAKEGRDFIEVVREIASIIDGPISAEVISLKADEMVKEAVELYNKIGNKNIVIKIPMCRDGLIATKELTKLGIKTYRELLKYSRARLFQTRNVGKTTILEFDAEFDRIGLWNQWKYNQQLR